MFKKNYDIKDADGKLVGEVDKKRFTASSMMTCVCYAFTQKLCFHS